MSFDQWRHLKYSYYTAHAAEIAVVRRQLHHAKGHDSWR
jgi:hypothetical protein